tara:strand:+ start:273 stop:446 length:174 start_codon:yes stop_codon:yes gene_type:complete
LYTSRLSIYLVGKILKKILLLLLCKSPGSPKFYEVFQPEVEAIAFAFLLPLVVLVNN